MKINVRWSDILSGRLAKTQECMVALALKRELGVNYVSVGYEGGSVLVGGNLLKLYLPQAVRNKIRLWDHFHFALPFSFELSTSGFLTGTELRLLPPSTSKPQFKTLSQVWASA
jgi:hypothetical protein